MPSIDDSDTALARDAQALAKAWAGALLDPDGSRARIGTVLATARERGDVRVAALSAAWEALHLVAQRRSLSGLEAQLHILSTQVRRVGWPRADALLQAALAIFFLDVRETAAATLARLLDSRPVAGLPAERFWTEAAVCLLYCAVGDFDSALRVGVVADRLANETGLAWCQARARGNLAFVFLSVGDLDGAEHVLRESIAASERCGLNAHGKYYNLLLTWALGGEPARGLALLHSRPDLMAPDHLSANPALLALAAYLRALQGEPHAALAELEAAGSADWSGPEQPALTANRTWMAAAVYLRAGQAARAQQVCEAFLARAAAIGWPLSPLNATQLYRVLSDACEALGDLRAALDALRRSQSACFRWVAESMRSRLLALHLVQPDAASNEVRLHQRLAAVARASAPELAATAPAGSSTAATGEKDRFLAYVTHEMRNPLNGVIGMTSLLALSQLDERQRYHLSLAQSSAQMLLALCNDVLDLAKLETGRFVLDPQPTDVGTLLTEVAQVFEPQLRTRGVVLRLQLDPALPPRLVADRLRLQQVLMNLLSNAAKFTRQGSITVQAWWQPQGLAPTGLLHVSVIDTGPGLNAAQRARLFQEFQQADAGVATRHGGTGLGLALCRSLLTRMDGCIDVDSSPGQGSRFWFELPLPVG